jgi:hypothetical protein
MTQPPDERPCGFGKRPLNARLASTAAKAADHNNSSVSREDLFTIAGTLQVIASSRQPVMSAR